MTDNGTLRDHMFDVIHERNELLRQVEALNAQIEELTNELLRQVEALNAQIEELTKQLSALWKVDND
jgi:predicted nuclease with TOPRIM domain